MFLRLVVMVKGAVIGKVLRTMLGSVNVAAVITI